MDMHVCPMVTPGVPPVPHVGGPIVGPGAVKTLIAGLPAAMVGAQCVCVGPPDVIIKGSFVCLIEGKPAARVTDTTAHGGTITVGCPTVLIGDSGGAGSPQARTMSEGRSIAASYTSCNCNSKSQGEITTGTHADGPTFGPATPPPTQGSRTPPTPAKRSWIEVEVVDDGGKPLRGERVQIKDAEGKTRELFTDEKGIVRMDDIAPGSADITMPHLDQDLWKPV